MKTNENHGIVEMFNVCLKNKSVHISDYLTDKSGEEVSRIRNYINTDIDNRYTYTVDAKTGLILCFSHREE